MGQRNFAISPREVDFCRDRCDRGGRVLSIRVGASSAVGASGDISMKTLAPRNRIAKSLALLSVFVLPLATTAACNFTLDGLVAQDGGVPWWDAGAPFADGASSPDGGEEGGAGDGATAGDGRAQDTGAADGAQDGDASPTPDAGGGHTWMSGFLMSAVVEDDYTVQSVDNAKDWYDNIGTWRTGTSRNNCKVFNANSYPDPGQAQTILDYNFGTRSASGWGPPARFVPSSVGLQPVWSTSLTRGDNYGLKDTNSGNADANFRTWFTKLVGYG